MPDRWPGSARPRLRKHAPAEAVAAAVRLAQARQKAATEIRARACTCGLTRRASNRRPPSRSPFTKPAGSVAGLVVDLCAGIGSDTRCTGGTSRTSCPSISITECAGGFVYNASVHGVSDRVLAIQARAEQFAIPTGAWVHLDPDRRASTFAPGRHGWWIIARRRITGSRSSLESPPARSSSARPPTSQHHFAGSNVEIELISLRGECKEATVWFGELRLLPATGNAAP